MWYNTVKLIWGDGMYIKVFYNRVNGEWNGFCIAGYHITVGWSQR